MNFLNLERKIKQTEADEDSTPRQPVPCHATPRRAAPRRAPPRTPSVSWPFSDSRNIMNTMLYSGTVTNIAASECSI
ncbi:hypothetical protein E2C01_038707 [Portunus trituberculatus]|uniref:Uncharacterized protein n=1 Tax=Portunus trituberculatus TaxID=210409 RepID=A0A5B7FKT1_PORTR|nr:hypothetical protein [Portunus trituberculatus]